MIKDNWPAAMVDIETLDTAVTARIIEIGIRAFDPETGEMGPAFSCQIDSIQKDQSERTVSPETREWWKKNIGAGFYMPGVCFEALTLTEVLKRFLQFIERELAPKAQFWSWGNFDFPILEDALGEETPWDFFQIREARSVCDFAGVKRKGSIAHRALADADQEATAVCDAFREKRVQSSVERVLMNELNLSYEKIIEFEKQARLRSGKSSISQKNINVGELLEVLGVWE